MDHVSRLPCILQLNLSKNAVVSELDYRTKILSKFGNRACEVCLDETPSTQKELDTAAVLHAIFKVRSYVKNFGSDFDKNMHFSSHVLCSDV